MFSAWDIVLLATGACGGVATVVSYVVLYRRLAKTPPSPEAAKEIRWWWGPFTATRAWVAYTATTVAAYCAVVYWQVAFHPGATALHGIAAGFNWSAAAWTAAARGGWPVSSVAVTAALSVAWLAVAQQHDPGAVNVALAALVVHHVGVDGLWWGGYVWWRGEKYPEAKVAAQRAVQGELSPATKLRRTNDGIAVAVHASLLLLFATTLPAIREPWQWMLVTIEVVSLVFHIGLAVVWWRAPARLVGHTNWYKWIEYAITATLGTLATGFASEHQPDNVGVVVLLLVLLGVGQQFSGIVIDFPDHREYRWVTIAFAFAAQAAEFVVVAYLRGWDVVSGAYWTYVVMWSMFGVVCVLRSIAVDAAGAAGAAGPAAGGGFRWALQYHFFRALGATADAAAAADATDLSEACYSCLGWVAKFAVAVAIYYEEFVAEGSDAAADALPYALVVTILVVGVALWQDWAIWTLLLGGSPLNRIPGEYRHAVAAAVHFGSAAILGVVAVNADTENKYWVNLKSWSWEPREWKIICNKAQCADDEQAFYVSDPGDTSAYPIIALATTYVVVSGLNHTAAAVWRHHTVWLRWCDYCVTAPMMLSVMAVLFGCDKLVPVVVAPVLLCACLAVAAVIEPLRTSHPTPTAATSWVLGGVLVVYAALWAPLWYAIVDITTESQDNTTATAPREILVPFTTVMTVLFSSFGVVYVRDFWGGGDPFRENKYVALSMIAKTTLHLFLGLTVVQQSNTVAASESEATANNDDMQTLREGLGGAGAIIVAAACLHYYGFSPIAKADERVYELRAALL